MIEYKNGDESKPILANFDAVYNFKKYVIIESGQHICKGSNINNLLVLCDLYQLRGLLVSFY